MLRQYDVDRYCWSKFAPRRQPQQIVWALTMAIVFSSQLVVPASIVLDVLGIRVDPNHSGERCANKSEPMAKRAHGWIVIRNAVNVRQRWRQ